MTSLNGVLETLPGVSAFFREPDPQLPEETWLGRTCTAISEEVVRIANTVASTGGAHAVARLGASVGQIIVPQVFLDGHVPTLVEVDGFFKAIGIGSDAKYIADKQLIKDIEAKNWSSVTSHALFTASDTAALISFVDYLSVIDAGKIASSLASVSVFGIEPLSFIGALGLNPVILGTGALAFAITAYDCGQKVAAGDTSTLTVMTLARCVAESALRIFLLMAGTFVATNVGMVTSGILGLLASSMAFYVVYLQMNPEKIPEPIVQIDLSKVKTA